MRFAVVLFLLTLCASAQASLVPTCKSADFGVMREADGKKTVRAWLVNRGQEPAYIVRVKPTCGCTAADFFKEEVMPGDSAWVDLTYNPSRRPGKFEKGVNIHTSGGEKITLEITGTVIATKETISATYPVAAGPLQLTEKTVVVPEIRRGDARHVFINAYNITDNPVHPKLQGEYSGFEPAVQPDTIPPGEIGTLAFYLNPRLIEGTGEKTFTMTLLPDSTDSVTEPVELEFHINIVE